jgi:hypothetical protein
VLQVPGLISGLAHLSDELREALVDEVLGYPAIELMTKTRLAEAVEHLSPVQRRRVVQVLDTLPCAESKAEYISSLAKGLPQLDPDQRQGVVDTAIGLRRSVGTQRRGSMLGDIAAQAEHLDAGRCSTIAKAILADRSIATRTIALRGLARGAAALSEADRDQLVSTVLATPHDWHRSEALRACGEHAGHFSGAQRSRLLTGVPDLADWFKGSVVAAFGKEMATLAPTDRALLRESALSIADPTIQALALAGLGAGAEALHVLRTALVPAPFHVVGIWAESALVRLCEDMGNLTDDDRQQLLEFIGQFDWTLRARMGEVLCTRLSLLSQGQREAVTDMVLALPDSPLKARLMATLGHGINAMERETAPA